MPSDAPDTKQRLDSWKAIAEYLRRDVSTVRRWERTIGLPVRRVPGMKGHSVFAFPAELDVWLKTKGLREGLRGDALLEQPVSQEGEPVADLPVRRVRRFWRPAAAAALMIIAFAAWRIRAPGVRPGELKISVSPAGVVASTSAGSPLWRYNFPAGETTWLPAMGERAAAVSNPDAILVATSHSTRLVDDAIRSGQLFWLSPDGRPMQIFSFENDVSFATTTYSAPWSLMDFRVQPRDGSWRIAVAAHHYYWWPGLVTVLDATFRRHGTFVHAGWIEFVRWLAPDRLVVGGFSNDRDAGMVALLDADALDGQSPVEPDSPYACASCGRGAPLRYLVFPRSEVNRASGSAFNRARLQLDGERLLVRTVETPESAGGPADVLYELSSSLTLISASYSDRYWDLHRELEIQGKLHHTRAECPDRHGPREIQSWEPATGWKTVTINSK